MVTITCGVIFLCHGGCWSFLHNMESGLIQNFITSLPPCASVFLICTMGVITAGCSENRRVDSCSLHGLPRLIIIDPNINISTT